MKLIIGLGNPGEKYKNTRHNVGYRVVEKLWQGGHSSRITSKSSNVFMNDSGTAVKRLVDQYSLDMNDLYIVHDDLDLPLGTWKLQFAKGPKDHGGINDIEQKLGTEDFWRVRIGVDARKPEDRTPGEEYVLRDFAEDERSVVDRVTDEVCKKLATL